MSLFPTEVNVLVVGAGPSGLALAADLKRRGHDVLVIDRQPAGANTSRAAVIHARTLEALEPLGVTADLIARGVRVPRFKVRDRDQVLVTIDFAGLPTAYPFTLMYPQNGTESLLLDRLQALGGSVVRPAELVGLTPAGDGAVTAHIRDGDGALHDVRATWLVGCDGMHSRVRDLAGLPFEGATYQQSFVLGDVRMAWPYGRDEVNLFFSPDGLVVVAPLPDDHFRIVATADDAPEQPDPGFLQALLERRGPCVTPARIDDCLWSSRFRVHHRITRSPRKGRVLLCGDAAHVHSPAGGQGMNTGIQDAITLAAALDSNEIEPALNHWADARHRVASSVVTLTDRMTRAATMTSPLGQTIRNAAIRLAGRLPQVRNAIALNLSELNTRQR